MSSNLEPELNQTLERAKALPLEERAILVKELLQNGDMVVVLQGSRSVDEISTWIKNFDIPQLLRALADLCGP
jgi:transcriptional regulatory protein LevR